MTGGVGPPVPPANEGMQTDLEERGSDIHCTAWH